MIKKVFISEKNVCKSSAGVKAEQYTRIVRPGLNTPS